MCKSADPLSPCAGTLSASRYVRERGLDPLRYHVRGLDVRDRLADHGNRWEYSDVVWRLGNATLDGGRFWLATNSEQPVLHAAEAKRYTYRPT